MYLLHKIRNRKHAFQAWVPISSGTPVCGAAPSDYRGKRVAGTHMFSILNLLQLACSWEPGLTNPSVGYCAHQTRRTRWYRTIWWLRPQYQMEQDSGGYDHSTRWNRTLVVTTTVPDGTELWWLRPQNQMVRDSMVVTSNVYAQNSYNRELYFLP